MKYGLKRHLYLPLEPPLMTKSPYAPPLLDMTKLSGKDRINRLNQKIQPLI